MCEAYVGAGLDPARFWEITPRLFVTEMRGAAIRHQRERSVAWMTAMLPNLKKPPTYQDYVGVKEDRAAYVRRFNEEWDRLDRAIGRSRA